MFWIIDGHNLIPNIPGISLSDLDDESKLIQWLLDHTRAHQDVMDVYFDQAPIGYPASKKFGRVTAHFIRTGKTADQAIIDRLQRLGHSARNITVVSSDRQVQQNARVRQAKVISSPEFIRKLMTADKLEPETENMESKISAEEVEKWMNLFDPDRPNKHE